MKQLLLLVLACAALEQDSLNSPFVLLTHVLEQTLCLRSQCHPVELLWKKTPKRPVGRSVIWTILLCIWVCFQVFRLVCCPKNEESAKMSKLLLNNQIQLIPSKPLLTQPSINNYITPAKQKKNIRFFFVMNLAADKIVALFAQKPKLLTQMTVASSCFNQFARFTHQNNCLDTCWSRKIHKCWSRKKRHILNHIIHQFVKVWVWPLALPHIFETTHHIYHQFPMQPKQQISLHFSFCMFCLATHFDGKSPKSNFTLQPPT